MALSSASRWNHGGLRAGPLGEATSVGSEEARLRAGLRPPLKLHVQVSACSFREDSATLGA